jgi:membrane-bound metal-dependent hydrolase YbcI (DUF457 family)
MPVVGHAFVGVATALSVPPKEKVEDSKAGWWLSALVGLAYLPDIVGHGSTLLGLRDSRVLSHSLPFALVASAVLAFGLVAAFGVGYWRAAAIALGSILGHDILDLLQRSDRVTGWPLFNRRIRLPFTLIPDGAAHEGLLFGLAFLVFLIVWSRRGGGSSWATLRRQAWGGGAVAGVILVVALLTHVGQVIREGELDSARECLKRHEYAEALQHLERLRRWPSIVRPNEVARLSARALVGLGDSAGAEQQLLAAARAEPDDFRTLADLALFYASSNKTMAERRRLVAPYQARLEREFTRRWDRSGVLVRIEERLQTPAPADEAHRASGAQS